jgi:hypothetical protein
MVKMLCTRFSFDVCIEKKKKRQKKEKSKDRNAGKKKKKVKRHEEVIKNLSGDFNFLLLTDDGQLLEPLSILHLSGTLDLFFHLLGFCLYKTHVCMHVCVCACRQIFVQMCDPLMCTFLIKYCKTSLPKEKAFTYVCIIVKNLSFAGLLFLYCFDAISH